MTEYHKWSEIRDEFVAGAGGEDAIAEARKRTQAYVDGYRLAERRKAQGLSQAEVAERMGVAKGRVSQIERGEVSTVEAIARYVRALGGRLQISAVFGDDLYLLRSADTNAA
jgi:DNA-binding XRE family transcriptional regulator